MKEVLPFPFYMWERLQLQLCIRITGRRLEEPCAWSHSRPIQSELGQGGRNDLITVFLRSSYGSVMQPSLRITGLKQYSSDSSVQQYHLESLSDIAGHTPECLIQQGSKGPKNLHSQCFPGVAGAAGVGPHLENYQFKVAWPRSPHWQTIVDLPRQ